ncbi:MAG: 2-oxoglutarate dehydrogenase E1 component, partial [Myxococcota bacterium]
NPSHLEAIDPVVVGRVRAKQRRHGDWEHKRVLGILVHGDAAFAGQGLVPETLNLTNLHGYRTGGTVHIIVNNQIGFTASPRESRSTPYCTDVAKMIEVPTFHVNGEDLDAVARTVQIAMEYRAQFHSDVVIDMFCYRQFGHNEMDEPAFTQPRMYERIKQKKRITEIYGARLVDDGVLTWDEIAAMREAQRAELEQELELGRSAGKRPKVAAMRGIWSVYKGGREAPVPDIDTGVDRERLGEIAERMVELPEGFTVHRKIRRLLDQRAEMGRGERPINWGMAELLAYGSLLWDGHHVRLTGQDSCRGTFSHRHAALIDPQTGTEYLLLGNLHDDQGLFRVYDSPLSEAGVLGFEYGYSLDCPDALVIWEAQFGDFANGAQIIFDQFIFSSEDKWHRLSGLTLFLPHGYEGQGPEHSSARIERFLQGAAEDNMQLCQPTTAGQFFHLLRRQVVRPWRKPLVVFTPKSLLRLPEACSNLDDLSAGRFQRVIDDPGQPAPETIERVVLCSGKVYYDLAKERERRGDSATALVRVEQLYPWPEEHIRAALGRYGEVRDVVWVQDEPANMGAQFFALPRLRQLVSGIRTVSRPASASPATGSHRAHVLEQERIMKSVFEG